MTNKNSFRFKQFTVKHDRCAMKVGTDGVLLGSWTRVNDARTALDVGCGTGLIALMLAQRNENLNVIGIDIDDDAVEQARENISVSPWRERIKIEKHDFNEVFPSEELFDLIVSNPPFYTEDTTCPDDSRQKARHATSLSIETMMKQSSGLLTQEGRLSLIVPYSAATDVIGEAVMNNLYLSRRTDVRTTPTKPTKRTMLEFGRKAQPTVYDMLTLKDKEGNMSDEYKALTEDFYL